MNDLVTEYCSTCETEITVRWNPRKDGYMIYCPSCGERLMLCDECQRRNTGNVFAGDCDYDFNTDSCRFNVTKSYYIIHILKNGGVAMVKVDKQEPPAELLKMLVEGTIHAFPAKHGVLIVNGDNVCGELSIPPMNATATSMLRSDIHRYVGGACVLVQSDDHNRLIGFPRDRSQWILNSLRTKEGEEC